MKENNFFTKKTSLSSCFQSFGNKKVFVVLFVLFSIFSYSQEIIISGLENIHATEGAAIVVKVKDNSVVYIASNSKNNSTPQVVTRQTRTIKKIIKKKSPIAFREKTSRATKKVVEKQAPKAICKSSPESEGSYFSESQTSKISFAPSRLSLGKYVGTQHSFLNFLFVFQEKQNSLYRFYKTKHLENSLFTRPPPSALI